VGQPDDEQRDDRAARRFPGRYLPRVDRARRRHGPGCVPRERRQSGRLTGVSRTNVQPDPRRSAATAAPTVPARVHCCCADCGGPCSLPPRWLPARSPEEGGATVTDRAAATPPAATRR